jgi:hypothetical protein
MYEYTGRRRPGLSRKRGMTAARQTVKWRAWGETRGVESMTDATREEREDRARLADESDEDSSPVISRA